VKDQCQELKNQSLRQSNKGQYISESHTHTASTGGVQCNNPTSVPDSSSFSDLIYWYHGPEAAKLRETILNQCCYVRRCMKMLNILEMFAW